MQYILTIAYDGTNYYGWQCNKNALPTIEGTFKKTIEKLFQREIEVDAASRTDRGVHAEAQVITFAAPSFSKGVGQLKLSLNQLLPSDIRVIDISIQEKPFFPSIAAQTKTYIYKIDNNQFHSPFQRAFAWHIPQKLTLSTLQECTKILLGSHDFGGFTNEGGPDYSDTTRTLHEIDCSMEEGLLTITIKGDAFLYRMARNIVGTLVAVGKGEMTLEEVCDILKKKDRRLAGVSAPAHGLVLKEISY